jgi:hypothetical protein
VNIDRGNGRDKNLGRAWFSGRRIGGEKENRRSTTKYQPQPLRSDTKGLTPSKPSYPWIVGCRCSVSASRNPCYIVTFQGASCVMKKSPDETTDRDLQDDGNKGQCVRITNNDCSIRACFNEHASSQDTLPSIPPGTVLAGLHASFTNRPAIP